MPDKNTIPTDYNDSCCTAVGTTAATININNSSSSSTNEYTSRLVLCCPPVLFCPSYCCSAVHFTCRLRMLLFYKRIVIRTHDGPKNPSIPLFLRTIVGPDYYVTGKYTRYTKSEAVAIAPFRTAVPCRGQLHTNSK